MPKQALEHAIAVGQLCIAMTTMRFMGGRMAELQVRLREVQTERDERRIAYALGRLALQAGLCTW